ncbi:MAG: hypothetical protein GY898_19295 [Proteobacteria bacterium]|nr:hypothetical protein [Pseudomonadota bacterium]
MRAWAIAALLLAAGPVLADEPTADDGFAPDPGPTVPVGFRTDFRLGWNLTDGNGVIDYIGMGLNVGPVFGKPTVGGPPVVSPFGEFTAGIAEDARPSIRIVGGIEVGVAVRHDVEIVPSVFGGYHRSFEGDRRAGGTVGAGVALRVRGPNHFFFSVEPVRFVLLPPPENGYTRYTTHFALDMGIVRFGGILP